PLETCLESKPQSAPVSRNVKSRWLQNATFAVSNRGYFRTFFRDSLTESGPLLLKRSRVSRSSISYAKPLGIRMSSHPSKSTSRKAQPQLHSEATTPLK